MNDTSLPIYSSHSLEHPALGRVEIRVRRNSFRTIKARWHSSGYLSVSTPYGTTVGQVISALERMAPALQAKRKGPLLYSDGMTIACLGANVLIGVQRLRPKQIVVQPSGRDVRIAVGSGLPFESPDTSAMISESLIGVARRLSQRYLIAEAREIAAQIGTGPAAWRIGRGHHVMGTTGSNGVISLSYMLVFLPAELRRFVVCHELAHLSEMNHSARFHSVCDRYCNGRANELEKKLKDFSWPVIR